MTKPTIAKPGYTIQPLYQWDTGQVLEIYGLALPVVPQVHFAHEGAAEAEVVQSVMDAAGVIRARIPDALLTSSADIFAYVCSDNGSRAKTLREIHIPVIERAKPDNTEVVANG